MVKSLGKARLKGIFILMNPKKELKIYAPTIINISLMEISPLLYFSFKVYINSNGKSFSSSYTLIKNQLQLRQYEQNALLEAPN